MKAIGGYFELELNLGDDFHQNAIKLNTGRNALEYILRVNNYGKVYLPYFVCDVLLEPLRKLHLPFEFYKINTNLEPDFNFEEIEEDSAFLYVNYFGLKDDFIEFLSKKCANLIIDNSQAFFSKPRPKIATFYSARKFFGVADGAYLYSGRRLDVVIEKATSFDRCSHLMKRLDSSAEFGFEDFSRNDNSLQNQEIKQMSSLTLSLLSNIDYNKIAKKRNQNFKFLHQALKATNRLNLSEINDKVPMVYPYWSSEKGLRKRLIEHKIYTATYWESVKQHRTKDDLEYCLVDEVVYLPIDQRYDDEDMNKILEIL